MGREAPSLHWQKRLGGHNPEAMAGAAYPVQSIDSGVSMMFLKARINSAPSEPSIAR